MCNSTSSTFLSTQLNILGWQCDETGLYILLLVIYFGLILGAHKLSTTIHQKHREALSIKKEQRHICCLVGLNIAHTFIHIVFILFISSNNIGFLIVSVVSHAIGTSIVYSTQRGDHKHPIRSLANALKHYDKQDEDVKKNIVYIQSFFQSKSLKY